MPRSLLLPLSMLLLVAIALAMLASAMLLPRSDTLEIPVAGGTAVVEQFYAAVNETIATGNPAALQHVVHPSFADENPLPGVAPGLDGLAAYLVALHEADPTVQLDAEVISASAQLVVTRVQDQRDATTLGSTTVGDAQAVWSSIEVFRVADGRIIRRWGQTDGLTLTRPLAHQPLALPIPIPRVVSLMRVTQAPGTRWDAPHADGPRLLVLQDGVLDVQAVSGSTGDPARAAGLGSSTRASALADSTERVMLTAGTTWLVPAGAITSTTSVGSTNAQLLVVSFTEPRIPNGLSPAMDDPPAGVTVEVLVGDLATPLETRSVTAHLDQLTLAPDADLTLSSTQGPILVAVTSGQLQATASGTAWVRRSRDGMGVASRADVLSVDMSLLLQPGGMVALRNDAPQPARALVVTIQDRETDRMGAASGTSSANETSPTASRAS